MFLYLKAQNNLQILLFCWKEWKILMLAFFSAKSSDLMNKYNIIYKNQGSRLLLIVKSLRLS